MIYVLGGENEDTEVLLTMEVFDPHCNVWRTQPKMTTVRKVRFSSFFFFFFTNPHTLTAILSCFSHFVPLFFSSVAVPPWKRDCMWWAEDHMGRFTTLWSPMTQKPSSGLQSALLRKGGKVFKRMFIHLADNSVMYYVRNNWLRAIELWYLRFAVCIIFSNNSTAQSQLLCLLLRLYYGCHTSRHWSDFIFQGICQFFVLKSLLGVGLFLPHLIHASLSHYKT